MLGVLISRRAFPGLPGVDPGGDRRDRAEVDALGRGEGQGEGQGQKDSSV